MENKYANGKPINLDELTEEEKSLAIKEWAEEDINLESAMISCIENGIQTFASCAGHNLMNMPYLSLIVTRENQGKILNIMNEVAKHKNIAMSLSYTEYIKREENSISVLSIYANMLNKSKIFNAIDQAASQSVSLKNVDEDVRKIWEFHKKMRTKGRGLHHNISYHKWLLSKAIQLSEIDDFSVTAIIENNGFKKIRYSDGYLCKKKFNEKLQDIEEKVDDYFLDNEEDEFFEKPESNVMEILKVNVDPLNYNLDSHLNEKDKSKEVGEKE